LVDDGNKNNANSNPYSCNTKFSAAGNQVVALARHVSVSLAREAKMALDSPQACVSFINSSHEECCADIGAIPNT
jgi:hypothetical protein